jgi:ABC-type nitrate/sulfonate/bicarbonate transport system substrate-binding protein
MQSRIARLLTSAVFLAVLVTTSGCERAPAERPKVRIGIQTSPAMALVMVAKDRGYFEAEGLDVELQGFTAGKFALQAFLGGSLDFAVAGEVPVTLASIQGNRVSVVSQVVKETRNEVRVVARRDSTTTPAAYFGAKRRKLATSFGGGPEFFTYNFLKEYGISSGDVQLVPLKPEEMPAALRSGSVDAISIFDPFAYIAEQLMGDEGITFTGSLYSEFYVLVSRPDDVTRRRTEIEALLRALRRAEQHIQQNPQDAQRVVVGYTKLTQDVVGGIWNNFVFAPALTPKLIEVMNAQAAWAEEKGDVPAGSPRIDFRSVVEPGPLRAVAPATVTVP